MSKHPEGYTELITVVSDETARDIIKHRQKKKAPLTARAARKIAKELAKVAEAEREDAIDTWFNRGWVGFEQAWLQGPPQRYPTPQTGGAPRSFEPKPMGKVVPIRSNYKPAFLQQWEAEKKTGGE